MSATKLVRVRLRIAEQPRALHLFRMWRRDACDYIWGEIEWLACGNVSTQNVVVPNEPAALGRWGSRYEGDWDFVRETAAKLPVVWQPEVIAAWNVLRDPPQHRRRTVYVERELRRGKDLYRGR